MTSPIIKICGLRTPEHVSAALDAGADWIGLVFYAKSKRVVDRETAATLAAFAQASATPVKIVGLFVNEQAEVINELAAACGLDYAQLSGDEWPQDVKSVTIPVIPVLRMDNSPREQAWLTWLQEAEEAAQSPAIIIDAHVGGQYGGTGIQADWDAVAAWTQKYRIMLAGGLDPENVATALQQVRPSGVDVSSGVETNGVKDPDRIRAFVQAVRSAAMSLPSAPL